MARVTVEDCLVKVDNRFDLVLHATKRARQLLMTGTEPLVPWDGDKATVVALRELASGQLDPERIESLERPEEQESEGETSLPTDQTN